MSRYPKICWYEGMNLEPHHFQHWDRMIHSEMNYRVRTVQPYDWGLSELSIDREAVTNGQIKLLAASGVMPDGFIFHAPAKDHLPPARSIPDIFPPSLEKLAVHLAVPVERVNGQNCQLDETAGYRETRYRYEEISLNDDNSGADERRIGIGRAALQLRLGAESLEDYSAIKIAEIVRATDGTYLLNRQYIPPCLYLGASPVAMGINRRLLERLVTMSSALMEKRRFLPSRQLELRPAEMTEFWLLHTLNSFIPRLKHFSEGKHHPEKVYAEILSLAGQLATFSPDAVVPPRGFPAYHHDEPGSAFFQMEQLIYKLLGEVKRGEAYIPIPLAKTNEMVHGAQIADPTLFQQAEFYLVTTHNMDEKQVADEFPREIRIASPQMLNHVLNALIPALPVQFMMRPPAGVPIKPGIQYFRLSKNGHFWEDIVNNRALSIYMPPAKFPGMKLELIAVREE